MDDTNPINSDNTDNTDPQPDSQESTPAPPSQPATDTTPPDATSTPNEATATTPTETSTAAPSETTSPTNGPTPPVVEPSALKSGKKKWLLGIILLIIVIIVVIGGVALLHKHNKAKVVDVKKDIPLLRVGIYDSGGVPEYPINYSYSNDSIMIALQSFEGLTGYQDQTKVVPLLATSWTTPSDTKWVFNIRKGVKFNTGRPLTAQAVKASLDYAVANQNNAADSTFGFLAGQMQSVTVSGPYQVTINTTNPDAVLLSQLALLPIFDTQAKLGDYDAGTGPYIVKPGTTPSSTSIDLIASNSYWGGHVYTREVQFSEYNNRDALAGDLSAGKLDIAGDLTASEVSSAQTNMPNSKVLYVPDPGLTFVGLNLEKAGSPLQSPAARQAFADALNIPAILKANDLQGVQDSQIVPIQLPGHNPSIQNTPYNPTKAKQLLATVKNANTPLIYDYGQGDVSYASEIAKELNAVGFNVKIQVVTNFPTYVGNTITGQYDIFSYTDTSATVDGHDILHDLLSGNSDYDNSQLNTLMAESGSTLSPANRISEMQQIATIVYNEKPIIPLYTVTRAYILTKPSYVVPADMPGLELSAYFYKVYQQ